MGLLKQVRGYNHVCVFKYTVDIIKLSTVKKQLKMKRRQITRVKLPFNVYVNFMDVTYTRVRKRQRSKIASSLVNSFIA